MSRNPLRLPLLVLLLMMPPAALAGDKEAMDAYKKGVDAVQAGRLEEGIRQLEAALAARAEEGSFKVGVMSYEFSPSRWLAEAHLGLGHCADAAKYLARAKGAKMNSKERAALDALTPRVEACAGGPPKPSAPPVAAASAPPAAAPCPQLADARASLRVGDAATALKLARTCLQANPSDAGALEVAEQVNAIVSGKFSRALREDAAGNLEAALALAKEVTAIDASNADAVALRGRLETAIAAARASAPGPTAVAAARPTGPAPPKPTTAAGPAGATTAAAVSLPAGVAAYFRGDLDAAIHALETDARPESLVVLACALATRGLVASDAASGQADLQRARQAWGQAQRMNPKLTLKAAWVSPRIRAALQ